MRRLSALLLLILTAATVRAGSVLTFDSAVDRAMKARGVDTAFTAGIARLERPPGPILPTVRGEASAQRAENIELADSGVVRFDALTLILSVDYPLFEQASRDRQLALARTSGQLFRRRALDEADQVFRETLDAYVDLYSAQRRLELMEASAKRATELRNRASTMLDLGQITTTTAALWQEQSLVAESQRLDQELARLDAETRLRQLIGDTTNDTLVAADLEDADFRTAGLDHLVERDPAVDRAALAETQRQLVVQELEAARRPRFLATAFGGVASVPESFRSATREGAYGIYGMRLTFTLPSTDAASATRLAEARLELEDASRAKASAAAATRTRATLLALSLDAASRRVDILRQQIELAKQRQESIARLVAGGVRTDADLFDATLEVARRESELVAVRAERWRLEQTARWSELRQKSGIASPANGDPVP